MIYLTGERIEAEKTVEYHSELMENMLLGNNGGELLIAEII